MKENIPNSYPVVVTGASTGIGFTTCIDLASRGIPVYAGVRKQNDFDKWSGIEGVHPLMLDVCDAAQISAAAEQVAHEHPEGIRGLVNNAGIGMMGAMGDTAEDELLSVYRTNVVGLHSVSRLCIPHLIASKGHLMHVGSVAGVVGLPFRGVYCSSKAAVELLAEAQSMELKRHGVRVSVLRPGDFKTAINNNRLRVAEADTVTYPGFESVCNAVNEEVAHAKEPEDMGRAVLKLLGQKRPPLYLTVAPPMQKLAIWLKRCLPPRTFEWLIARRYPL